MILNSLTLKFMTFILLFNIFNVRISSHNDYKKFDNSYNYECETENKYDVKLINDFNYSNDLVEVDFSCDSIFDVIENNDLKYDVLKEDNKYLLKVFVGMNIGEYSFSIRSESNVIFDLYIFSDGSYVSSSLASINDGKAKYYKKNIENSSNITLCDSSETISNYYDQISQYNNLVFGSEDYTYIESIKECSSGKVKISGVCTIDEDGALFPLRNNRVVLRSYVFINVGYGVTYTDNNGYYCFELDYENYVANEKPIFYVSVQAETSSSNIYNESGYNYVINSNLIKNINNGSEIYSEFYIICSKSDRGAAYLINQVLEVPYLYVKEFENIFLDQINVIFPITNSNSASYNKLPERIAIPKNKYNLVDVLTHEYGHYIDNNFELSSDVGGKHYINENLIATYGKDKGMKLAYSEGLATYLGISSQLYFKDRLYGLNGYGDLCYSFYGGSVVNFNLYENQYSTAKIAHGEGSETSITSSLLKFLDDSIREYDNVKIGDFKMWKAIKNQKHVYFYLLIDDLVKLNPNEKNKINIILEKEGFSTKIVSGFKFLKTSFDGNLYKIIWSIDNENLFNGSIFNIHFFGMNGEYIINNISSNNYILTDEDINSIFVLDYNFVEYYLESFNNVDFNSGYYASQISKIYFQTSNLINFGESTSYYLTDSLPVWFKFIAPYSSVFYFESVSNMDLFGELFNYICLEGYSNNVVKQNNDGGNNFNFKLSIYLNAGSIIFLRVKGNENNVSGNFLIKITSNHVSHNYVYSYKQYSSKQHKSYCECGEYVYSSHSYTTDSFSGEVSKYCEYCNYYNSKGPGIVKPSL